MSIILRMPSLSPTMTFGTINKWIKNEGDKILEGDVLCTITTDKSTIEWESQENGFLRKILIKDGEKALVNQEIAIISHSLDENVVLCKTDKKQRVVASPLAKKIAKDNDIDLSLIVGSGPRGRIVSKDLQLTEFHQISTISYEEELTHIRKIIGNKLLYSKQNIPHYYVTQEVIATKMVDLHNQLKEMRVNITFNDLIIRAVSLALREHRSINSGFNSKNNKIIRFKTIDISIAVSTSDGIITPIIFNADCKNIIQISKEVRELAKKGKENTLLPEQYQGGSFTISNLGMFGVESFNSIINSPQGSALAVGVISEKPIVVNGVISLGSVMHLTLSSDHRVIDGVDSAKFLSTIKKFLENPSFLIL